LWGHSWNTARSLNRKDRLTFTIIGSVCVSSNFLRYDVSILFDARAIFCPTIEYVEQVNDFILSLINGEEKTYLSSDTPCQSDEDQGIQSEWFTSKFLNEIKCSGIKNHRLKWRWVYLLSFWETLIKKMVFVRDEFPS